MNADAKGLRRLMNPYSRAASIWGGIVEIHILAGHSAQAAGDAQIAFHFAKMALDYEDV